MANPWFPGNSTSALSPLLRTTGDNHLLVPPIPPDPPDPDNPLSLSLFPPLNSPSSQSPKTGRVKTQQFSQKPVVKDSSLPPTAVTGVTANNKTGAVASSSRSERTVHFDLEKFKIVPPKSSSPIQTNQASRSFSTPPPFNPIPTVTPQTVPQTSTSTPQPPLPPLASGPSTNAQTSPVIPPHPVDPVFQPPPVHIAPPLVERLRKSQDKSLSRLAHASFSESGRPRVLIPDSVFLKGAELHKDFIICYFNGRPPPFNHIQTVLNHLWGKGKRVEIHTNPLSRSMLVRIPSDYLRQKILEKRVWYVGDSMFQAVQWTSSASQTSPPLDSIQIWAHLTGIPLDLRHQQGLSLVAGLVGEPKETDDFTLNLVSLTLSHVKVAVDLTKPLPSVVEFNRESGEVVEVSVAYPWVPPTCSHCKELGHIMRNCLLVPLPPKPPASSSKANGKKQQSEQNARSSNVGKKQTNHEPEVQHSPAPAPDPTCSSSESVPVTPSDRKSVV